MTSLVTFVFFYTWELHCQHIPISYCLMLLHVALCFAMLPYVATCCPMLHYVALLCTMLFYIALSCFMLLSVGLCCTMLRYVALCCAMLPYAALCCAMLPYVALCCALLPYVVLCCPMLPYVALCCAMLPYVTNEQGNRKKAIGKWPSSLDNKIEKLPSDFLLLSPTETDFWVPITRSQWHRPAIKSGSLLTGENTNLWFVVRIWRNSNRLVWSKETKSKKGQCCEKTPE